MLPQHHNGPAQSLRRCEAVNPCDGVRESLVGIKDLHRFLEIRGTDDRLLDLRTLDGQQAKRGTENDAREAHTAAGCRE
jgi:hypothetical protein